MTGKIQFQLILRPKSGGMATHKRGVVQSHRANRATARNPAPHNHISSVRRAEVAYVGGEFPDYKVDRDKRHKGRGGADYGQNQGRDDQRFFRERQFEQPRGTRLFFLFFFHMQYSPKTRRFRLTSHGPSERDFILT
jgi:hypothetical protein